MSRPRAAMSVATSTGMEPSLNCASALVRAGWLLLPCIAAAGMPSATSFSVISILTLTHAKNLKLISIDVDEIKQTNIKNIGIEAQYNKSEAISYKITTSKYILGYITRAKYSKQFVDSFKDSNILIINFAEIVHEKNPKYLDMEEITELIREINPELVILNGFSKKTLDSDPLDLSRKIKQELQKDKVNVIKTQILPAKELMTINPESYNIRLKQKNLKGFFE